MPKFLTLQRHGIYVLIAAVLFGASAPLAKLLLERTSALSLAALAYCGGGLALGIAWMIRRMRSKHADEQRAVSRPKAYMCDR